MKISEYLALFAIIMVLLTFNGAFIYPTVDDFAYDNAIPSIAAEKIHHINPFFSIVGYNVFLSQIRLLTDISYNALIPLPLLSIAIVLLIATIFKSIVSDKKIWMALLSIYIIYISSGGTPVGKLFCHEMGFVLFLTIVLLIIIRYRFSEIEIVSCALASREVDSGNHNKQRSTLPLSKRLSQINLASTSILSMISIISINFSSYKMLFLSVIFLIFCQLIMLFSWDIDPSTSCKKSRQNLIILIVFCIVFIFSFNSLIYNSIIPLLAIKSEVSSTSGIEKLFSIAFAKGDVILSKYLYRPPITIIAVQILLLTTMSFFILINCTIYLKNILIKNKLSILEEVFFAIICANMVLLLVYTKLGIVLSNLIIFSGLIAILSTYYMGNKRTRKFVSISIIFILLATIFIQVVSINYMYHSGQRDSNMFSYLYPPCNWYIQHDYRKNNLEYNKMILDSSTMYLDIFSLGFMRTIFVENNYSIATSLRVLSENEIKFLLHPEEVTSINACLNSRFFINTKADYFAIWGWKSFASWSNHIETIHNNSKLNIIYNSEDVIIGVSI